MHETCQILCDGKSSIFFSVMRLLRNAESNEKNTGTDLTKVTGTHTL